MVKSWQIDWPQLLGWNEYKQPLIWYTCYNHDVSNGSKNYFLRVPPPTGSLSHSLSHSFWAPLMAFSIRQIFCHSIWPSTSILSTYIWHSIWHYLAFILSAFYLTFYLAFCPTFALSVWHMSWHSTWHSFWHSTWHSFWQLKVIWHILRRLYFDYVSGILSVI